MMPAVGICFSLVGLLILIVIYVPYRRAVIPFVRAFFGPYLSYFPIICALEASDGGHDEASLPPSFLMRD
ncbi:hypothetical protein Syun_013963 [Stephania yunnanensis]|uniref:Uncharacterized protein n=1 Tax=Stephania yunnanensis TaxID=152371 RepID=A0AAP0P863_9MAGN